MKKKFALRIYIWLVIGSLLSSGCNKDESVSPGHITKNTVWSGAVTLTGDIIVDKSVVLTIEPGTIVTIMADQDDTGLSHLGSVDDLTTGDPTADPDAGGTEYQKNHISIIINGAINCCGTAEKPIIFKSSKADPFYTDWIGITVNNGVFEHTIVEWCLNGIYSLENFEQFTLDHCHIRHIWAAGVGIQKPFGAGIQANIKHSTIEDCGHEAVDTHSPGSIELAYNLINDSQVGFNLHDEMNANIHHNIVLNTTFPILSVNSTDVFITQCTMQAAIQENTRWTFQGWTIPLFENPAAVFITNSSISSVIITNSIIFDSPMGLSNEAPSAVLQNGYLNMDNVSQPYAINAIQGSGCLEVPSGFVDKAIGDFHLSPASPLLNAGNPVDGNPAIGAYGGENAEDIIGY